MSQGSSKIVKHSVTLYKHRTSISLENIFWEGLRTLAKLENKSLNELISEIDKGHTGNLSSALRVYIMDNLKS